jgi:hypothetical protein
VFGVVVQPFVCLVQVTDEFLLRLLLSLLLSLLLCSTYDTNLTPTHPCFYVRLEMASPLLWLLVKDNNSFLVKRNGITLSREQNNLRNVNSYKYSGLAHSKTVGINRNAAGNGIELVTSSKVPNRPATAQKKQNIRKGGNRYVFRCCYPNQRAV